MTFKQLLYIRTALLFLSMVALVWVAFEKTWYIMSGILFLFILLQMIGLTRFIQKTNKDLSRFLEGMLTKDYTLHFREEKWGGGFDELMSSFNKVGASYRQARIEKEVQYQYFKKMIEELDAGVISIRSDETIALMNRVAIKMLQIPEQIDLNRLKKMMPKLGQFIEEISPGTKEIYEWNDGQEGKIFKVHANEIRTINYTHKVITFQNIKSEMDSNEMESWHKLIRVLTHEIMNSVTPITTLSETIQMILEREDGILKTHNELTDEDLQDIQQSVRTIGKRSQGLQHFVVDYRKLTKIPKPVKTEIKLVELFNCLLVLFQKEFRSLGINLTAKVIPEGLTINADEKLIEQVLINLVLNSKDAVKSIDHPTIHILAERSDGVVKMSVTDNGKGIPAHIQPQVFVPFYSTKENGSGIGLSLSRNIIRMHGGKLYFISEPGNTSFILEF